MEFSNLLNILEIYVITNFDSWGGIENFPIKSLDSFFKKRNPLSSSYIKYSKENEVINFSNLNLIDTKLIIHGVIYGKDGYLFKKLFK